VGIEAFFYVGIVVGRLEDMVTHLTFQLANGSMGNMLELLHTHLGFIFPNFFPCLLVIISHYPISYILGENILFQLTLQFD
jgi:hypothetical protein